MDLYTLGEVTYKNGYEKGYEDAMTKYGFHTMIGIVHQPLSDSSVTRCISLRDGDVITIIGERSTKVGEYLDGTRLLCIRLNKRDKWWQIWKPRYKSSTFRYMGEENE